jgi:hypothetical protein
MKRMMMIAGLAAALCAGGWMSTSQPDGMDGMQGEMPDMDQMLAMMTSMSKPDTEHHAMLKKLAGDWTMTARFKMDPSAPAEVSKGTAKSEMVLGGRQVMSTVEMDMVFMGQKQDFSGIGILGYDKGTNEFVSTWMDTMGTGQMRQTGTMEGDTIVVEGTTKHPMMGEYTVRNVYKFVEGGYNMEFWEKGEMMGPEFMNTGVIEYRKAPKKMGG